MASEHTFKLLQAECKKKRPSAPGQVGGDTPDGDNRSQPKRKNAGKAKAKAKAEA